MKKSVLVFWKLWFTCLIIALFLPACKNTPEVKTQNYYYVDQMYYKAKAAELLKCLNKPENRDSCNCLDKYWEGRGPKPDNSFPEDELHQCCDCNKVLSFAPDVTNDPDLDPLPVARCRCLDAVIAVDTTFVKTFALGSGKKIKSAAEISGAVKKELVTIGRKPFFKYSFPDNFNDTVRVSFRNVDMGHIVVVKGRVEDWLSY